MKTLSLTLLASLLTAALAPTQAIKKFQFEVETLGGRNLTQDDFKSSVLIIDFWGTWCGPCKKAVPNLVKLYSKYKHHGLEIVGLNYREKGSKAEVLATIRDFAATAKITYPLAIGTAKIQRQVLGFAGYPTMLFFNKGLNFDHLETGFDPAKVATTEKWIRSALGLDTSKPASEEEEESKVEDIKLEIPAGVIFKPGNHDTGFEFKVNDLSGKEVQFADFRGKQVVLALTSTWDHEAVNTAGILNKIHAEWASKGVAVVAASLEMKTAHADKITAIQGFVAKHKTTYRILPAGLKFLKKVHRPEGLPLFLVFDAKGTLALRQRSDTIDKVLKAIRRTLTKGS